MKKSGSITEAKRVIKAYHAGKLSEEYIKGMEELNKMPMAEFVRRVEMLLEEKSHNIYAMTLADLHKWKRHCHSISDEEKNLYETCSGCSYEEFEDMANSILHEHERKKVVKALIEKCEFMEKMVASGRAIATTNNGVTTYTIAANDLPMVLDK